MPVPKRKRSRTRRDSRFANKGMVAHQFAQCTQCEAIVLGHQACKDCGFYDGKKVITTKADRTQKRDAVKAKKAHKKQHNSAPVIASSDNE